MIGRVLVALPNPDMRATVADVLADGLWPDSAAPALDEARDEEEARGLLARDTYELAVVDAHLPPPASAGLDRSQRTALSLLKDLRQAAPRTLVVVVATVPTVELFQCVQDLGRCRLVVQGGADWSDQLVKYARQLLSDAAGEASEGLASGAKPPGSPAAGPHHGNNGIETTSTRVTLEIRLDLEQRTWSYAFRGQGTVPFDYSDRLHLSYEELAGLVGRSRRLAKQSDHRLATQADEGDREWSEELKDIGRILWKELFEGNPKLLYQLGNAVARADGIENCRLRFVVERAIHPLALEAVAEIGGAFWMLEGPVVRGIDMSGSEFPLFFDPETREQPVNILVIEADVQGTVKVGDRDVELKPLKNVHLEADHLVGLTGAALQLRLGRIRRIPERPEDLDNFAAAIEAAVQDGPWHVVHYAGHSYYDSTNRAGYVFLPGQGGLGVSAVRSSIFRHWIKLARARFVYLSSCHSSEDDFVFELAKAGVPSILGFRWDIDDALAANHAEIFYRKLFERRRSLEHAFLETRRYFHAESKKNRLWAAPTLILQVG